jgi:hypothetical protein
VGLTSLGDRCLTSVAGCATYAAVRYVDFTCLRCVTMLYFRNIRRQPFQIVLIVFGLLAGTWWFTHDDRQIGIRTYDHISRPSIPHPLDDVIENAREAHEARLSKETTGIYGAVYAYRNRRGRHPPPGFERWHTRATRSQAVIVESFFDQIYEDLEPFWGMEPAEIRGALADWKWTLKVRNGKVKDVPQGRFRSRVWGDMIREIAADLPDMDVAINPLDEPRIFAPWAKINGLMDAATLQRERMMSLPASKMLTRQPELLPSTQHNKSSHKWIKKGQLWPHVLKTCQPDKQEPQLHQDITTHTHNWTATKDICANHHWAEQHGSLIKPATLEICTDLLPIFSAAKLQGSNDILLPPPSYYTDDVLFTGKGWFGDGKTSTPWHKKLHGIVWRGKATGGLVHESTWQVSHRQRLVSMLNSSDAFSNTPNSQDWPPADETTTTHLSDWLATTADAGFTDTFCPASDPSPACKGMHSRFQSASSIPMKKQYNWKYLPDIDGNSLSGRFRAFLTSNSSPMKATIYKEWHDSRLMPWVHFIPLDITLRDLWATMAYFLGFSGGESGGLQPHDFEGERIAEEGRLWADKVLRREDMLLYVHRVLLEYGRLCDDERDRLGFTDDWRAG